MAHNHGGHGHGPGNHGPMHGDNIERIFVRADEEAYLDIRVILPNDKFPKINFGGRIIGQNGSTIKALSRENKCKLILNTPSKAGDDDTYDPSRHAPHLRIKTRGPLPEALRRMANIADRLTEMFQPEWRDPNLIPGGPGMHGQGMQIKVLGVS